MLLWFSTAGVGLALWLLQALFAYHNYMLTPETMTFWKRIPQGIPFTGHGSTWWVLFCLIPLIATLVALYADQWSWQRWLLAAVVGVIVSGGMHYLYTLPVTAFQFGGLMVLGYFLGISMWNSASWVFVTIQLAVAAVGVFFAIQAITRYVRKQYVEAQDK